MTSQENAIIATLASELRATEISLAQWRAHSGKLHAQLRALRKLPTDESLGEPRVLAGNSLLRSGSLVDRAISIAVCLISLSLCVCICVCISACV